ncbi:MAG: TonB-dependent receptor plug domain-containing protein, partial [Novosphingobium sp.]|nr:TonB-dependent receptor plug domain-containing protein [Novosphingobium sp.]
MKKSGILTRLACSVSILATPVAAFAQSSEADLEFQGGIQDIVVTARKRQESLQNVPVVATALGNETLERFQVNDLKSVATLVPGLSLGGSILSVGVQASLRGVGTSSLDPGVDSSVALNIDGMALSQGLAFASGMFDLGQIEVL